MNATSLMQDFIQNTLCSAVRTKRFVHFSEKSMLRCEVRFSDVKKDELLYNSLDFMDYGNYLRDLPVCASMRDFIGNRRLFIIAQDGFSANDIFQMIGIYKTGSYPFLYSSLAHCNIMSSSQDYFDFHLEQKRVFPLEFPDVRVDEGDRVAAWHAKSQRAYLGTVQALRNRDDEFNVVIRVKKLKDRLTCDRGHVFKIAS